MSVSLAEAAQLVGLHRSNILRAIKAGRISGVRGEDGAWRVDESELARVYGDLRSATLQPAQDDTTLALKLEHAEQRISDLTRRAERAERDADEMREIVKRLALTAPSATHQAAQTAPTIALPAVIPTIIETPPAPVSRLRRAWRWMQARG